MAYRTRSVHRQQTAPSCVTQVFRFAINFSEKINLAIVSVSKAKLFSKEKSHGINY